MLPVGARISAGKIWKGHEIITRQRAIDAEATAHQLHAIAAITGNANNRRFHFEPSVVALSVGARSERGAGWLFAIFVIN